MALSTPEEQGSTEAPPRSGAHLKREILPWLNTCLSPRPSVLEEISRLGARQAHTLCSPCPEFHRPSSVCHRPGEFKGVDESPRFFPDMKGIANLDERKAAMRLRDILTMRTGTDYHEDGPDSPHYQLNNLAAGWDKFYLDRPMIAAPGTSFRYDSGGVILISAMLKRRTGMHALEYAKRYLFKPLGIEQLFWFGNAEGHTHTGGGLNLAARDAAKLGQLYLNKGRWGTSRSCPRNGSSRSR
jgi:hypothetical protein